MDTPVSLLARLRQPHCQDAWTSFVHLYTPLLFTWARGLGLQPSDAADLVQDVFVLLLRELPRFDYDDRRSFRAWLKTVLVNKYRDVRERHAADARRAGQAGHAEAVPDEAALFAVDEYRRYLVGRALQLMQAEFPLTVWKACWEYVVAGRPPAEVAAELGVSVNSVYLAKSRVLARLRQELDGLFE